MPGGCMYYRFAVDHLNGNLIYSTMSRGDLDEEQVIRYLEDDEVVDYNGNRRPCPRCGRVPTEEGCDACIGMVHGLQAACCGHGIDDPYYFTTSGQVSRMEGLWTARQSHQHLINIPRKSTGTDFKPYLVHDALMVIDKDIKNHKVLVAPRVPILYTTWKKDCPRITVQEEQRDYWPIWKKFVDGYCIRVPGEFPLEGNTPFIPDIVDVQYLVNILENSFQIEHPWAWSNTQINDTAVYAAHANQDPAWAAPMEEIGLYFCAWVDDKLPLEWMNDYVAWFTKHYEHEKDSETFAYLACPPEDNGNNSTNE